MQHMMPHTKEIQEQLTFISLERVQKHCYGSGTQENHSESIYPQMKKLGRVVNLPSSGQPTNITPRVHQHLIHRVTKEHIQYLQTSLSS